MQATKKIYLMANNLEVKPEKLYMHTIFYRPHCEPDRLSLDFLLAQIHVITLTNSFHCELKRKNINKELAFNLDLVNRLESVFSGKYTNFLITSIQDHGFDGKILVVGSQLQMRSIRVILFEISLEEMSDKPFALMRKLMISVHQQKQFALACLKAKEQKQREKIEEIDQIHSQLKDNYKDEVNIIKQKFIPVLNQAKKKLVKCFGLQANFNTQTEQEQKLKKANQSLMYDRQFYKINNNGLGKVTEADNKNGVQDLFAG